MRLPKPAAALALLSAVLIGVLSTAGPAGAPIGAQLSDPASAGVAVARPEGSPPSFVVILMDDASMDLVQAMPTALQMARDGADFSRAFVVDSLCCVSRTVLMTGQYPHQTGVLTNLANDRQQPVGGWEAFRAYGNAQRSVNLRLQEAGYTTGYVGKFLNQYNPRRGRRLTVPEGWSDFQPVFETAYNGWDFGWARSRHGKTLAMHQRSAPPFSASPEERDAAYVGTFVQQRALKFIESRRAGSSPYFLVVAPYAPHNRVGPEVYPGDSDFPAMFRDRPSTDHPTGVCGDIDCLDLTVDDLPGFGDSRLDNQPRLRNGAGAATWQSSAPLSAETAETGLRNRARMVQSVDRMLREVLDRVDDNTYVVLTSDNGLHLGQWGMGLGKGTPYDTDVHVPLVVVGPGVRPGQRDGLVSNLDLAPTVEVLAGLDPAPFRSGVSFADSLTDARAADGRFVFLEHTFSGTSAGDPDARDRELASIPSYVAVRSARGLLVRYDYDRDPDAVSYAWELYRFAGGMGERTNIYGTPEGRTLQRQLVGRLGAFLGCRGATRDDAVPDRCRALTR